MVHYQVMLIIYSETSDEHDLHSLSSVGITETETHILVILQAAF